MRIEKFLKNDFTWICIVVALMNLLLHYSRHDPEHDPSPTTKFVYSPLQRNIADGQPFIPARSPGAGEKAQNKNTPKSSALNKPEKVVVNRSPENIKSQALKNSEVITVNGLPEGIRFLINRPNLCTEHKKLKYITYFNSAPDHFTKRAVMRSTWVGDDVFPERIMGRIFFLGRTLNKTLQLAIDAESEQYKDIIQGDFIDSYWNLTLKGLMALKWVDTHCKQAEFALKADDDMFVNIYGVIHVLQHYKHNKHAIFGYCKEYGTSKPFRNLTGKWFVSNEDFSGQFYPTYCLGTLYAMTRELVPELYRLAQSTPLYKVDDVYLSGMLAEKVDNMQHMNFKHNFTIKCQPIFDDMKKKNETFSHAMALCAKWQLRAMWARYKDRVKLNIRLVEEGVYNATYTIKPQAVLKNEIYERRKAKPAKAKN